MLMWMFIRLTVYLIWLTARRWLVEARYNLLLLAHQIASLHKQVTTMPTMPEGVLLIRARIHGKFALDAKLAVQPKNT